MFRSLRGRRPQSSIFSINDLSSIGTAFSTTNASESYPKNLRDNEISPLQRSYTCEVKGCPLPYGFTTKKDLTLHLHSKHGDVYPPRVVFNCPVRDCKRYYARRDTLKRHLRSHHPETDEEELVKDNGLLLSDLSEIKDKQSQITQYLYDNT